MAKGFVVTVKIVYRSDMFVFNPVRKLLLCTSNVCHNFNKINEEIAWKFIGDL